MPFPGLQSDTYQEDIYPMTAGTEPALSASEWLSGINRGKCRLYALQISTCSLILHFGKGNAAMQHSPASPVGVPLCGRPSHAVTEHMASPRHRHGAEQAASPESLFLFLEGRLTEMHKSIYIYFSYFSLPRYIVYISSEIIFSEDLVHISNS